MNRLPAGPLPANTTLAACLRHWQAAGYSTCVLAWPRDHYSRHDKYSISIYDRWDFNHVPFCGGMNGYVDGPELFPEHLQHTIDEWNAKVAALPPTITTFTRQLDDLPRTIPLAELPLDTVLEDCLRHWQAVGYQVQLNADVTKPYGGELDAHLRFTIRLDGYGKDFHGAGDAIEAHWQTPESMPDLITPALADLLPRWNQWVIVKNTPPPRPIRVKVTDPWADL